MHPVEKRTSFLQVPNVFFETCDLPESAQTLFLRLAAQLGKQQEPVFIGSTRQFANLVRMPKTTVNRTLYVLTDSLLITVTLADVSSREVMAIEANMDRLWELNTYHTTVAPVPIWDNILPDCPKLGHHTPEQKKASQIGPDVSQIGSTLNQNGTTLAQNGTKLSHSQAQIRHNTKNTKNTEERKKDTPTAPAPAHSSLSPHSVHFSSQEKARTTIGATFENAATSGTDDVATGVVATATGAHLERVTESAAPSSLLASLTDEQADFWLRWCAISHSGDDSLSEKLLPDIAWLAERVHTTADLESLYRSNAAMLLDLAQAQSRSYTPPHLRNLTRHYQTWQNAQNAVRERREQASQQKAVPGTGTVTNWTLARLSGKLDAPPVYYPDVEPKKKPTSATDGMSIKGELAAMLERMRR